MVYLNRIYTKTGDTGETSLGDGRRVSKSDQRIIAYGTVDELNSNLGCVLADAPVIEFANLLQRIQNDLFDVGADLCIPESDKPLGYEPLRVTAEQVTYLEQSIDQANEKLQPLKSFILPGGSVVSARLHVARTICRRAEIEVVRLMASERINPHVMIYLNRLSDLLFVLARCANDNGQRDVLWVPGANR
ncbi:cob(I)yrinic acid a,c-diamide adenosyltransferase [Schlesneria paludicola]|uniref:cob(I)yrinic acid a,c-diamide adenosyltransferase n=1 Tax=Schlesneria paludicola TaxID=360056 RepID=UPI000299F15E|nr:cob(I)yrinic acid a,c-diamide adenosyltransferase [Schlesneria paludicola]